MIERFVPAGRGPSGANTLAQLVRAPARRCSGPEFEPGILRSTSTGFQLEKKSRYNRAEKKVAGRYMAPRTPRWPNGWPSPGRASNTHSRARGVPRADSRPDWPVARSWRCRSSTSLGRSTSGWLKSYKTRTKRSVVHNATSGIAPPPLNVGV